MYVFEPDGTGVWVETTLSGSDGASGDYFGWSVDISGPIVVAGALWLAPDPFPLP